MKNILTYILFFSFYMSFSQVPEPVGNQIEPILLYNATLHVGNGEIISKGYIAFNEGKITHVGKDNSALESSFNSHKKIDLSNNNIYPGLILPNSKVGLEDVSAVRATVDHTELGDINSNIRSLIAYNTDSDMIATFRFNGILISQVVPDGDLITGNSSIMMMIICLLERD